MQIIIGIECRPNSIAPNQLTVTMEAVGTSQNSTLSPSYSASILYNEHYKMMVLTITYLGSCLLNSSSWRHHHRPEAGRETLNTQIGLSDSIINTFSNINEKYYIEAVLALLA